MVNVRQKIKTVTEKRGIVKHGAALLSCVMIVLAAVMFSLALFAPYKYYSDRDILHIVHVDDGWNDEGQRDVYVAQNIAVHQSMFRVFSAAEALGDASVLHSFFTDGVMPNDPERLTKARKHLDELRKQYAEIYATTEKDAVNKGIVVGSRAFAEALAKNLSHMNIMALDLLETATTADKPLSYDAMYAASLLGMFCGLFNILIAVLSVITLIFAVLDLATKRKAVETPVLLRLFVILSAACLLLCLFNTAIPPASGPLAMCCTAVATFFIVGTVKSVMSDGSDGAVVRNMTVGALGGAGMLALAATPSFTMYLNGLGGQYLYYRGTIGTVYSSWMEAMSTVGLEIPHGAITVARVFGIIVCVIAVICADKALIRLYGNTQPKSVLSSVAMFVGGAAALTLCIVAAGMTAKLQNAGTLVKYIAGASWYVFAAFMLIGGLFGLLFKLENADAAVTAETQADTGATAENAEPAAEAKDESADGEADL